MTTNIPARKTVSHNQTVPTRETQILENKNMSMPNQSTLQTVKEDQTLTESVYAHTNAYKKEHPFPSEPSNEIRSNAQTFFHHQVAQPRSNAQSLFHQPPTVTPYTNIAQTPLQAINRSYQQPYQNPLFKNIGPSAFEQIKKRPTFFIASDTDSTYSRDTYQESDSDCESESDFSSCSGDSFVEPPTLFTKTSSTLLPTKRASLLSVAIQRNAFRKSQAQQVVSPVQVCESNVIELSASLKQGLEWDHAMPFNTTLRSGKLDHPSVTSTFGLNYW